MKAANVVILMLQIQLPLSESTIKKGGAPESRSLKKRVLIS